MRPELRRLRLALYLARHLTSGIWKGHGFLVLALVDRLSPRRRERWAWLRLTLPSGERRRFYLGDFSQAQALAEVLIHGDYDVTAGADVRTIVDLGANAGQASTLLRDRFPDALIVAVEPDPDTARLAARNLNRGTQTRVIAAAVTDHDGTTPFTRLGKWSWGSNVIAAWGSSGAPQVEVRSLRLGTLLDEQGIERVDLLKVDVEGAELMALTSDNGLDRVRWVIGELHPSVLGMPAREALAILQAHGRFPRAWMHGEFVFVLVR
ncbi:MAG TPA: FkbM family methyltransferase [Solirubrobacteraceae bacterium]|jgi:FkbM family methyltransferase|nr:FkbM family methyltransferase [Solirubrobacteraceae bacterium]